MLTLVLGVLVSFAQLASVGNLPQILTPAFKSFAPLHAGKRAEVMVSFIGLKDYRIDRMLPITLKLTPVPGVTLPKTEIKSSSEDPKSKDGYYVDLPTLKIPLTVSKAGNYEIPGKLIYFFCSERDGFCSRQILDVKVPVIAQ